MVGAANRAVPQVEQQRPDCFSALMDRAALGALLIIEIVDGCVTGRTRLLLARQQTPFAHRPRPCLRNLAVHPVNVSCKAKLTCEHQPRAINARFT
jgi:hypothetical protein